MDKIQRCWELANCHGFLAGSSRERQSLERLSLVLRWSELPDAATSKITFFRGFYIIKGPEHFSRPKESRRYHYTQKKSVLYLPKSSETNLNKDLHQSYWRNQNPWRSSRCEIRSKGIWTVIKHGDGESWIRARSTQSLDHGVDRFWL